MGDKSPKNNSKAKKQKANKKAQVPDRGTQASPPKPRA
jgi:hypothetical protein